MTAEACGPRPAPVTAVRERSERVGIIRQSGGVLALNVGGAALAFSVQLALARLMGVEQFGLYALVLSWVFFLVLVSRAGLDSVVVRFGATYRVAGETGYLRGLIRWVGGVVLGVSGFCAVALLAGVGLILGYGAAAAPCFIVGAALVPLLAMLQTNKAILLALEHPVQALVPEQIVRPALFISATLVAGFGLGIRLSGAFVMALAAGSMLVAVVLGVGWVLARLPKQAHANPAQYRTTEWLGVSLSLGIVTVAEAVTARADIIVLGFDRPSGDVGAYAAALTIASTLEFLIGAVTFVLAPKFARLYAQGELMLSQRLLTRSTLLLLVATVPSAVVILLFSGDILALLGEGFTTGHGVLQLIVVSQLVVPFTGPIGLVLSMSGQHRPFAVAVVITSLANLLLLFALVSSHGAVGAAAARFCTAIIRCIVLGAIAWRRIGVIPTPLAALLPGRLRSARTS